MAECEAPGVQGADEKAVQIKTTVNREETRDWEKKALGHMRESAQCGDGCREECELRRMGMIQTVGMRVGVEL